MKINSSINMQDLNGYNNVGFSKTLDPFCEGAECEEIISDSLSYLDYSAVEGYIEHIVSKLKHGGKITLHFYDIVELSKCILRMDFNILEANRLVYGNTTSRPVQCQLTLPFVAGVLQRLGMKILKKRISGYEATIEAMRP